VHEIESLIFLLAAAALLAQLARLLKVPYPILLVLGGLVMGFVPGLPDIEIPPEVIFVAFLPPLLNSAAFSSSPLDLRAQLRPIVMLAVGLVLATMGAVAVIAHALIGLPWAAAFVLGAISLAAALAVPLSTNAGDPFPGRDLIVFLTFSVILATLVLQGLTLGPLIAALRLRGEGEADKLAELRARLEAARVALDKLERLGNDGRVSPESKERMREYYEENIQRYTAGLQAGGTTEEYAKSSGDWREWRRGLLAGERETPLSFRDAGEISPEVMRRIERDLDLQESRLGG